jgi:XTP/dITP diphosphohydrolase
VEEVALHKARQAYAALGRPVITEDGGFFIDELDGFPGPLAKPVTSKLGLAGIIHLADMTATRAAHFESALAYIDAHGARTFTSTGRAGTIARHPAAATRAGAWSQLWDIWIPPGATRPVSAFGDRDFSDYLAAWRDRSVFTQLGRWLQARQEENW